jgi:hypothetical protein
MIRIRTTWSFNSLLFILIIADGRNWQQGHISAIIPAEAAKLIFL